MTVRTPAPARDALPGEVVVLDADDVQAAAYLVGATLRDRAVAGRPVPHNVLALYRRLDQAATLSRTRQETGCGAEQLELIGSRLAAKILGWTQRQVQRRAADLDGQIVGGRLTFDRAAVLAYKAAENGGNE